MRRQVSPPDPFPLFDPFPLLMAEGAIVEEAAEADMRQHT
jgi:hypothetical protein